jgi:septum formation protein
MGGTASSCREVSDGGRSVTEMPGFLMPAPAGLWQVWSILSAGFPVLLLASASPARRRLLEQAAIPHRIRVSGLDEEAITDPDPTRLVLRLAEAKARAVLQVAGTRLLAEDGTPCGALLACDSVLSFEGEVFGKPRDRQQAIERWQRLSGRWAELHTGHCLLRFSPESLVPLDAALSLATVTTRVQLASLDLAAITAYVATGEPLACAGGFALEGRGGLLVERIDGCYSNVIGLSLPLLRRWFASLPPHP